MMSQERIQVVECACKGIDFVENDDVETRLAEKKQLENSNLKIYSQTAARACESIHRFESNDVETRLGAALVAN